MHHFNRYSSHGFHHFTSHLRAISRRMESTERPYIEDILDKYSSMRNLTVLALGSSYWTPPPEALAQLISAGDLDARETHRYGNIQGDINLRELLLSDLHRRGLDRSDMDVLITPGANQAFTNVFLSLVDDGDHSGSYIYVYIDMRLVIRICVYLHAFSDTRTVLFQSEACSSIMRIEYSCLPIQLRFET